MFLVLQGHPDKLFFLLSPPRDGQVYLRVTREDHVWWSLSCPSHDRQSCDDFRISLAIVSLCSGTMKSPKGVPDCGSGRGFL
jgi:hypothetical protein